MMKKQGLALAVLLSIMGSGAVYAEETMRHELNEVVVEETRANLANGTMSTEQTVGILGAKDIIETPLHQVTYTEKALDTFSKPGRGLLDTLALDPAVRATNGSLDTSVYIRGLSTNGFRWNLNGVPGMTHQMQMPYNFAEEVSVIAGPSIGITGSSSSMSTQSGGVVNMISKKAKAEPNATFGLSWSNDSYFTQEMDIGKRFGENKEYGVRIMAMNGNGGLAVDGTNDKKRGVYINLDHAGDHSTTNILAGYDYDSQDGRSNTINLDNSITSLPKLPKNTNNLSPAWSNDKYENYTVVLNHKQKFDDHAEFFINGGYHKEDYTSWLQQWSSRKLLNLNGDYTGTYTQMPVFHTTRYIGTGIKGDFKLGDFENNYVFSVDKSWFKRSRDNNVSAANKYPVTGNIYTGASSPKPTIVWDPITKQYATQMSGWSLIDTIKTPNEKVELTVGLHSHSVENVHYDDKTESGKTIKSHATSPVLGLVYKFTDDVSIYADHTETFSEGSSIGASYANSNEILPPSKTKQNEIGVKYRNADVLHTFSAFDITQANAMEVPNPADPARPFYRLDGEKEYKGLEYSAVGKLSDKWNVIFGISYLDAKQSKTKGGINDGRRISALPEWSSDLALTYQPDSDTEIIGRINYTGKALLRNSSSYAATIEVPSATLFDLGIKHKTKIGSQPVTLGAMCYNVFDKTYWYASGENAIGVGSPRTFMVSASFDL